MTDLAHAAERVTKTYGDVTGASTGGSSYWAGGTRPPTFTPLR